MKIINRLGLLSFVLFLALFVECLLTFGYCFKPFEVWTFWAWLAQGLYLFSAVFVWAQIVQSEKM